MLRRGYAVTSLISDVGLVAGPALAGLLFLITGWIAPLVCGWPRSSRRCSLFPRENVESSVCSRGRCRGCARAVPYPGSSSCPCCSVSRSVSRRSPCRRSPRSGVRARWPARSSPRSPSGACSERIWFGGRRRRGSVIDRYLLAVFLLGVLLAPVGLARGPVALSVLLIAAGLALGPATVSLFETLDVVAPGSGAE